MTFTYGFAPVEKILTPTTLAEMLEISERHLTDLRHEDMTFPAPVMLGTLPRWSPAVIRRWMDRATAPYCSCADAAQAPSSSPAVAVSTKTAKKTKGAPRVH
ncbi:MAG: hypothetical protein L0H93_21210 [Nocardioides sp.]|nr:hypothetical protein [Nocardioides sp.]